MIVRKTLLEPAVTQALINYLTERPYKEVAELVNHLSMSPVVDVTIPDEPASEAETPKPETGKKPLASAAKGKAAKDEPQAEESENNG